ncbi:MAG: WecB/TagA/CpsF family glycosyltransferase [Pseudomonadota bacterium]|nr:WecB/TagA/CpsF family glycosyltransferase [Pseudomonadota bacterium]
MYETTYDTTPETVSQRIQFLGLPLDIGVTIDTICGYLNEKEPARFITFINPSAWAQAKRSPDYLTALQKTSLNLADGQGVAVLCQKLTGLPCSRISFDMTSLADPFFKAAVAAGATLMLVGGKPGVDESVHGKLQAYYPKIKIVGTQHGYGDFEPKTAEIMAKAPDVVIVAMGTPRQENFILHLKDSGFKGIAITCGGFFDQYLQADPYYPKWIDRWNLRFAYRLYKEPRRLWQRYLLDYPVYLKEAGKAFVEKYRSPAFTRSSGKNVSP